MVEHVFHTKHDLTPAIAWDAFNIVARAGQPITPSEVLLTATYLGSPLGKRGDPAKVIGGLKDLGLVELAGGRVSLTVVGSLLARGLGRYEPAFRAAVHTLYFWNWLKSDQTRATPSWSYAQACKEILASGPTGITYDDLVLRITVEGKQFQVQKVSFSRSSVSGIVPWLEAQNPPLVEKNQGRVHRVMASVVSPTLLRLSVSALCSLDVGSPVTLDDSRVNLLQAALMSPRDEILDTLQSLRLYSDEFILSYRERPLRLAFRASEDPFISQLASGQIDKSGSARRRTGW